MENKKNSSGFSDLSFRNKWMLLIYTTVDHNPVSLNLHPVLKKKPGQNMKEKPSHEPEENASVNFEPNTGSTTLWLQLAAPCRPVKWPCVD